MAGKRAANVPARAASRSRIVRRRLLLWSLLRGRLLLRSVLSGWHLFGLLSRRLLLGCFLPGRQRLRLRGSGDLRGRVVLAENRESATRKDQSVFKLCGSGRGGRACSRRRSGCGAARLPFQYAADPAHARHTFALHRAGLYAIDPLRRALKDTTLVADDRRSGLEAAVVIDFLGIGAGEGGEIAGVGRKPCSDLGGNEGRRAFLKRACGRVRGGVVGRGRYTKMCEAMARALGDPVGRADPQDLEQEHIGRRFD